MGSYSRTAYMAIKAETTENTAVTPTVFIPFMSEDVVTEWGAVPAMPVSGNRALNLRDITKQVNAPSGTINILVEPKTIGYFLKAIYGSVTTGVYFAVSAVSGDWAVGNTVTGGSSAKTATIAAISGENDYFICTSPSGAFTDGEALSNGSTGAATLGDYEATVYAHQFSAPQSSLPTFTVEIGFDNEAYRYTGVRFHGLNTLGQSDNIITAGIQMIARSEFKHARVTAITSNGAGSQTITVDQTTGLAASDTVKIFRPSTGAFLDFSAESVKTHTINAVATETTFTVTNLQTSTAVGDLVVLAPQTPSYTIDSEFYWIGGSVANVDDNITSAIAGSGDSIENFTMVLTNEVEGRFGADGTNVKNRFPANNFLKGLTGSGSITRTYTDMTYLDRLRNNTNTAIQLKFTGGAIGSTAVHYAMDVRIPNVIFDPFNPSVSEDELLGQEMAFNMYDSSGDGYFNRVLLINDVTSYA